MTTPSATTASHHHPPPGREQQEEDPAASIAEELALDALATLVHEEMMSPSSASLGASAAASAADEVSKFVRCWGVACL